MFSVASENINDPIWVTINEVSKVLNLTIKTIKEQCRIGKLIYKIDRIGQKSDYYISFNSLPEFAQLRLQGKEKSEVQRYSESPVWAKCQADKYLEFFDLTENLFGKDLKNFIAKWNAKNPDNTTSYQSIMRMRKRYNEQGITGLLAKYGHSKGKSSVENKYFDYFKKLYMVEGSPSLYACWQATLGYAMRTDGVDKSKFPSHRSFQRKLENEIPISSVYLSRKGKSAWNRKYGNYIERDYSSVNCGEVWVSDHAQIDIACFAPDGNVVFPWVTTWRDYKSGKWLGWTLQCGSPNSDRIFQAFYYAAEKFGLEF